MRNLSLLRLKASAFFPLLITLSFACSSADPLSSGEGALRSDSSSAVRAGDANTLSILGLYEYSGSGLQKQKWGTGMIWRNKSRVILTAAHVVRDLFDTSFNPEANSITMICLGANFDVPDHDDIANNDPDAICISKNTIGLEYKVFSADPLPRQYQDDTRDVGMLILPPNAVFDHPAIKAIELSAELPPKDTYFQVEGSKDHGVAPLNENIAAYDTYVRNKAAGLNPQFEKPYTYNSTERDLTPNINDPELNVIGLVGTRTYQPGELNPGNPWNLSDTKQLAYSPLTEEGDSGGGLMGTFHHFLGADYLALYGLVTSGFVTPTALLKSTDYYSSDEFIRVYGSTMKDIVANTPSDANTVLFQANFVRVDCAAPVPVGKSENACSWIKSQVAVYDP